MIRIRKSSERGVGRHGWLTTFHTFSFANYYDPRHMGFRDLRVINEDTVAPGRGFGSHRHDNMEIVSIVMSGELAHRDSTGGEGVLRAGEVQHMSAGSGVVHSEFNGSDREPVEFFQIWIEPAERDVEPGYTQRLFPAEERHNRLRLVVSPDGAGDSLRIRADAKLYAATLSDGASVGYELAPGRGAWIQVARGEVEVNGERLEAGDGVAVEDEPAIRIASRGESEILLFDLK